MQSFEKEQEKKIKIEYLMKKVDVKIVTTRKQYIKWTFRPTFKREK